MLKKFVSLLLLPLLLAGCATHLTNLGALHQPRKPTNLYPVEVSFDTQQQTVRWQSIRPHILVGNESIDMRPTPLMTNRWEGLVPVGPGQNSVEFRYKLDFQYNRMGTPGNDSVLSRKYTLQILD
jgi:hypothetical protein